MSTDYVDSDGYEIRNGRIVSPGKFEGERRYMPMAYNRYLAGWADNLDGGSYNGVEVGVLPGDAEVYPELRNRKRIRFYIRVDGFVVEY